MGCNIYKDGNEQQYGDRIHLRIGIEGKAELDRLAAEYHKSNFKWDRGELQELREYYKQKIKDIQR